MKFITLITITLFTLTLKAQNLVTCPPSLSFQRDTLVDVYSLVGGNTTAWYTLLNMAPNVNAKEGYTYEQWQPANMQAKPDSDILSIFLATQRRYNLQAGLFEQQAYYCVFTHAETKPAPKKQDKK